MVRPVHLFAAAALSLLLGACQTVAPVKHAAFVAIPGFGAPFEAADAGVQVDPSMRYRVAFPATHAASSPTEVLPALDRAARFLNLLGAAGRTIQPGDVVVVISGPATTSVLTDVAWRTRHPEVAANGNPNLPLIRALRDAGAVVAVCSQALHGQKIDAADVDASVRRDLSAMTTLVALQAKGYAVVPE
ncbi:DsrE family protein [Cognatilysobacter lacus]|nr:DsrE family protein [Lysobacter lacus]